MNVASISPEIGLTPYRAPAKTAAERAAPLRSERPAPPESVRLGPTGHWDNPHAPQPVVNGSGLGLEFSVDEDTHTRVIKVIDRKSGDVVRQIPPEEVINFLRQFQKSKGLFISLRL